MQHQYFLERHDGTRMPIGYEQCQVALASKRFFQWIATSYMTVIRAHGADKSKPQPRLKFGGRGNVKHPSGYRGN